MNVLKSVRNGFSLVLQNYKMILIIYIVNLCASLLLAIPFYTALNKEIAFKGIRDDMITGFNMDWWLAFKSAPHGLLDTLRPTLDGGFTPLMDNFGMLLTGQVGMWGIMIVLMIIAYMSIAAFFNGGVLGLYADEKRSYSIGRFFSLSGFYFHHFMALVTTVFLVLFLFYKLLHPFIFGMVDNITGGMMNELAVWWTNFAGFVIVALLLVLIRVIFDYAKVILVVEGKDSSWLSIALAARFVVTHPLKTLGLFGILLAIGVGMMLVMGSLIQLVKPGSVFLLVVLMLMQQAFLLLKIGHRLFILGAQLSLYQQRVSVVVTSKKKVKAK